MINEFNFKLRDKYRSLDAFFATLGYYQTSTSLELSIERSETLINRNQIPKCISKDRTVLNKLVFYGLNFCCEFGDSSTTPSPIDKRKRNSSTKKHQCPFKLHL
eukprot:GAHX01002580.1.p1 GENE.GAHX01002580.1~~GAHX01002580.1.p1  ORF type:complete len:117 (-),score=16.61 GAHX01002580.1:563-874(-)